jgi:4-hydroxy-tetrahydrodipicolinate reductase
VNLGLFGRGRLGTAIAHAAAQSPGVHIAWQLGRDQLPEGLVDVAVDASRGPAVPQHLAWALEKGCDLVIGATGFVLPDLAARVGQRIGVLVAPNFSLTIALVARLTRILGAYAQLEPRFDPYLFEHHRYDKHDAPSGTAQLLARALLAACPRKKEWRLADGGPLPAGALSIGVLRAGHTYSSHTIGLDAEQETLTLHHQARSAGAFAQGCLRACTWLFGRKGVFTMDDVARDVLAPLLKEGL